MESESDSVQIQEPRNDPNDKLQKKPKYVARHRTCILPASRYYVYVVIPNKTKLPNFDSMVENSTRNTKHLFLSVPLTDCSFRPLEQFPREICILQTQIRRIDSYFFHGLSGEVCVKETQLNYGRITILGQQFLYDCTMSVNYTILLVGDEWYPPYHPLIQTIGWIVSIALSLETVLGNAMVLVAYHLERSISKQLNNRFIVSLAISDLIIGIEGIPFFTVYVINGDRWPLGAIACETWLFLDYTLCLVSILTVLLITADRYLSVCHTAKYLKWQTPFKIQMLILISWLLPALIFGLMIYGWPWIGEREEEIQATSNGECYAPFLSNPFVNMSMYLAYYWTTLIAMLILYKGIHKAAKKLEKRSRAREHRHIALLLTQRLGTQVGVGLMLHARKYHEEVMKEKKQLAQVEVKDSGYTTNNTLSTSESSDRRRSSFALLAKAVQSTQRLAKFRGRGTTFAFRTNSNEESEAKGRQLGVHVQAKQHLERLPEQNSSSQIGTETASWSVAAPPNSSVRENEEEINSSLFADDEVDDEDEFPTDVIRRRFDSAAIVSLSMDLFLEESLSSVLRFNPSTMASPLLDPAQSDTSSELLARNNKRHCFSLNSHPRKEFIKCIPRTTGSLKERRIEEMLLPEKIPPSTPSSQSDEESRPIKHEEVIDSGERDLLCPTHRDDFVSKDMPQPLPSTSKPQQLTLYYTPNESTEIRRPSSTTSSTNRREERRPSSRKTSHPEQRQKQENESASLFIRICNCMSSWMRREFGANARENAVVQDHMHNTRSRSFSSMSSISSSTQPPGMASKHPSLLPSIGGPQMALHQKIPTLTITRDSLQQNVPQLEVPGTETKAAEKDDKFPYMASRNDISRRSSGFLQALFAPISTFQRRRKKTKAEKRAHKAFRTITFIVGLFAILWSPYYVVATIYGFCHGDCIPGFLYNISYYMCYLNSSLNPFAYALANRQFRSAFYRILRGNFRKSN